MNSKKSISTYESPCFDELSALAKEDPATFAELKKSLCEEIILNASEEIQPRLRAQQCHLNLLIEQGKNPDHTNMLLYIELIKQLNRLNDTLARQRKTPSRGDNVISFPIK